MSALAGMGRSFNRMYENRNHDLYSNGEKVLLQKLSNLNPEIIFDVGANVGDYSIVANEICPQAKIFAFEPVPETFAQLKIIAQERENIHPKHFGLYEESGRQEMKIYPGSEHASLFRIQGDAYKEVDHVFVETKTGDQFMREEGIDRIDLLKLDVEGAEMGVLKGMKPSFAERKIRLVQFEYGYINIATKNLLADYYAFFEPFGYMVGKLYPKSVEFRPYLYKHEDFIGPNHIAVHRDDTELIELLQKS